MGQQKFPLFAKTDTKFFTKIIDAQVEFLKDAKGVMTHLRLYQGPEEIKAPRAPQLQRQGQAGEPPAVESGYIEVNGGKIYYEAAGKGTIPRRFTNRQHLFCDCAPDRPAGSF